ncbi:MAG: AbrB/MazE/SpoVT family DNA-binding domain-containing protein [Rhodospirillaceae bacterium]|nr:AbrB/MazE/SpoVT family DNA-binding domain-containing protein [Rhodospirillaceae bacterium]
MGANLHIRKWGSSLAVRIPKAIAEQCEVSEGSAVEMDAQDGRIVLRKKSHDLADMLSRITADNLHAEQDFGEPEGNEQW